MNFPAELKYTKDHEWVRIEGDIATVGVTDFAQSELGDIVFVEIETQGESLEEHAIFGTVEAVKTVSDLFMPVSGTVIEVNAGLEADPAHVNNDTYGSGWMIKVKLSEGADLSSLMDAAAYEALVRLAQDFVMRVPLIVGQGNFGSVDGDAPAAERYTEAKLALPSEHLMMELKQRTVDLRPNYDNTRDEPIVLPAQFPNLLVNGSSGIAVGLATNIPPHNLGDVIKASIHLIENPEATTSQLLDRLKGPDFPLGGKILIDRPALTKIYEEGSGSLKIQGQWKLEEVNKVKNIIVYSIPFIYY